MVRLLLVSLLDEAGYAVTEACDGADALSKLAIQPVDLLLTDIRMPNLDGWMLAERAREMRADLAVLYITGWSDVAPRQVAGSRLVAKPFVPKQILAAVETLLQAAEPASTGQCIST